MKNKKIVLIYILTVFIVSFVVFIIFSKHEVGVKSRDISKNTYPKLIFKYYGEKVNLTNAYVDDIKLANKDMGVILLKDNSIEYEVSDGSLSDVHYNLLDQDYKLIEDGSAKERISLKNKLKKDKTYILTLDAKYNGKLLKYSVKVYSGKNVLKEHIKFIKGVKKDILEKNSLVKYATSFPNIFSNNKNNFEKVDINSSATELKFGDVDMKLIKEQPYKILYANDNMSIITVKSLFMTKDEDKHIYFNVKEYFRVVFGGGKLRIVDYKRNMHEYISMDEEKFSNYLGLQSNDVKIVGDKNNFVVSLDNTLLDYNVKDKKLINIIGNTSTVENDFLQDDDYKLRPLKIDEDGNVDFLLLGRIGFGRNEGKYGIYYLRYNATNNKIQTVIYIPVNMPTDILDNMLKDIAILNDNKFQFMLGDTLYQYDIRSNGKNEQKKFNRNSYVYSAKEKKIAYRDEKNLKIYYLDTNIDKNIVDRDEVYNLIPIGFLNSGDFAYSRANKKTGYIEDIIIINATNEKIKTYTNKDKILGAKLVENGIEVELKDKNNKKIKDYIINREQKDDTIRSVTRVGNRFNFTKYINFDFNDDSIDVEKNFCKLYRGHKSFIGNKIEDEASYYVIYRYGNIYKISDNIKDAIEIAREFNGQVRDEKGGIVWQRQPINDIIVSGMPLSRAKKENSLTACILALKQYYTISKNYDNTKTYIDNMNLIFDDKYKNVSGIDLESLLFFSQISAPVMMELDDNNYVILLGTSGGSLVFMSPMEEKYLYINYAAVDKSFKKENKAYVFGI